MHEMKYSETEDQGKFDMLIQHLPVSHSPASSCRYTPPKWHTIHTTLSGIDMLPFENEIMALKDPRYQAMDF